MRLCFLPNNRKEGCIAAKNIDYRYISSKYSRTKVRRKEIGKLKKTTKTDEKWPPVDITVKSATRSSHKQKPFRMFPCGSGRPCRGAPRVGRGTGAREPLCIITSIKYSEQMIHWSSFSSTSFMWLRTSSFCACTFSFSSCKDTTQPIRHSGGPTRMQNRTGRRANYPELDPGF